MTEHSITRSGTTRENSDADHADRDDDGDGDDSADERNEAELKRELRESVVGQAIIEFHERQRWR